MKMKKLFALVLATLMIVSLFAGCKPEEVDLGKGYTYKSYTSALATNWNPHSWEESSDSDLMSYIETPLVSMSIKNSETGEFQWIFEAATSVEDVTAANKGDLTKYKVTLPEGKTAEEVESGYVFEIKLNPKMKWQNGVAINADTYIYSMKQLLNSKMRNYRANLYYAGESAVAGALAYYNSEAPIYENDWIVPNAAGDAYEGYATSTSVNSDGKVVATLNGEESVVYFSMSLDCMFFGASASFIYNDYGYGPAGYFNIPYTGDTTNLPTYVTNTAKEGEDPVYVQDVYKKWKDKENAYGVIAATEELLSDIKALALNFGDTNPDAWNEFAMRFTGNGDKVEYDGNVGCYKVDDYTIRYVLQTALDRNYFLTSCTSNWIVYEELYEANKDTTGELVTTKYGTSKETTMSYGVYKIDSMQPGKQMVLVQNENWYDWEAEKDSNGNLVSYTDFMVDGKSVQQYQTTKVVIDVMEPDAAKQAFLKGDLTVWSPNADDLLEYATSDNLYKADETYTMSFFFNTGLENLKAMDASKGNTNSVVLSNINFRKAMSLAINRADFVAATEGWKPAYALMNTLYYYDIYNDPTTSYRGSEQAMQAVCNLYGVEYGAGKAYATLKEAYESITGYNLTEAKALMKTACEELVAAGLYTAGQDIVIRIGWAKGPMGSADEKQLAKINQYVNAALEGSGFGTIKFEGVDNITDRYGDVAKGEYAIGWGAWGGAAFYPFRNMQVYCDTDQYEIHEAGCWDPKAETLTITIDGEEVTKTWYEWSGALIGTGAYADADFDTKLHVTATMEEEYLKKYYRIPFAGTTVCTMLGDQLSFYTEDYNIMYGWGGLQLATWNYNDTEWYNYVQSNNGALNYQ